MVLIILEIAWASSLYQDVLISQCLVKRGFPLYLYICSCLQGACSCSLLIQIGSLLLALPTCTYILWSPYELLMHTHSHQLGKCGQTADYHHCNNSLNSLASHEGTSASPTRPHQSPGYSQSEVTMPIPSPQCVLQGDQQHKQLLITYALTHWVVVSFVLFCVNCHMHI